MPKSRKRGEREAEDLARVIAGIALLVGVVFWAKTKSMAAGIAVLVLTLAFVCAFFWLQRNARLRKRSHMTLEEIDREKLAMVIDGLGAKEPPFRSADAPSSEPSSWLAPTLAPAAPQVEVAVPVTAASLTAPACPICVSPMVRRSGRYGEFWGCSQYPECQGKRS